MQLTFLNSRLLQVLKNFYPVLGVIFFDWSVFAIFYAYWLETLAIGFFSAISIALSNNEGGGLLKAISYMIVRTLILLFYLIFIVVFLGVIMSSEQGKGYEWVTYLTFIDSSFRYSMLTLFVLKLIGFIAQNSESSVENYKSIPAIFDGRQIVIHVTIIVGFFGYFKMQELLNPEIGLVVFTLIFATIKTIVEYFTSENRQS
jgi:hypothetical protein